MSDYDLPEGAAGGARPAGNRRIDRVLAEDYLAGLTALPLEEVRARRHEAEQEEVDLSYIRKLLQGRIDIVRAELSRRRAEAAGEEHHLVEELPHILADEPRGPAHGLGRHVAVEPSRTDSHRRYVEALVADVDLSDVTQLSEADLDQAAGRYAAEEESVSAKRRAVQDVMDRCSAEITRRYREGEADVADLLAGG